jgi:hypothetical protein
MTIKYTEWPQNITTYHKIYQMATNYTDIFQYNALQNLPKSGFLVWKCMYHLATLDTIGSGASFGCEIGFESRFRLMFIPRFFVKVRNVEIHIVDIVCMQIYYT